jgi:ribosomal protein L37E
MNAYICPRCGEISHSSAKLEHLNDPTSLYCGYPTIERTWRQP